MHVPVLVKFGAVLNTFVVNKTYEFGNNNVKEPDEGILEFLERKKMEHLWEPEKK